MSLIMAVTLGFQSHEIKSSHCLEQPQWKRPAKLLIESRMMHTVLAWSDGSVRQSQTSKLLAVPGVTEAKPHSEWPSRGQWNVRGKGGASMLSSTSNPILVLMVLYQAS